MRHQPGTLRGASTMKKTLWRPFPAIGCVATLLLTTPACQASVLLGQQSGVPAPAQDTSAQAAPAVAAKQAPATPSPDPRTEGLPATPEAQAPSQSSTTPAAQQGGQQPVGTATAPYEKSIGVPASRPAGAVIAPAKQRRARSFTLKLGLIAGAAVAVGTVVALSNASSSRPR